MTSVIPGSAKNFYSGIIKDCKFINDKRNSNPDIAKTFMKVASVVFRILGLIAVFSAIPLALSVIPAVFGILSLSTSPVTLVGLAVNIAVRGAIGHDCIVIGENLSTGLTLKIVCDEVIASRTNVKMLPWVYQGTLINHIYRKFV